MAEVQELAGDGVQEAVLTGVHLGSYGRDLPGADATDLKRLTETILRDTDIVRLRLSSLEPWDLAGGFFDLWQRWPGRLCPHLHLPLQAGTDKQLRAMARRCTLDSYRRLVEEARAAIPDLIVTTDLIVGFPGETDGDFAGRVGFRGGDALCPCARVPVQRTAGDGGGVLQRASVRGDEEGTQSPCASDRSAHGTHGAVAFCGYATTGIVGRRRAGAGG